MRPSLRRLVVTLAPLLVAFVMTGGVAVGAATPAAAPATAPAAAEVETYLRREMAARSIPGLAWAAVSGGTIAAEGYLGRASIELPVAVDERSLFAVASLDKQLTAAGVLVLAQRGKVSLDDRLDRWVEGEWQGIRLRHLLSHTSGLPDSVAPSVEGTSLLDYTPERLLANVRGLPLLAPAGERYVYSDANFFLAQLVTEAAAGEPWRSFVSRELFAAAGMEGATFMDPLAILPGRVAPYSRDREGSLRRDRRLEVDYGPHYNDLGMTARDFARWLLALGRDRPLSAASRESMWTPVALADGRPHDETWQWRWYGLGVGVDRWGGRRVITHSGHSGVGFVYLPDEGKGVVVFTSLEHSAGSDPIGLAWGIAGRLWPDLALATGTGTGDPDPAGTAALRGEYERLLVGTPDLDRWVARSRQSAWDGSASLAGRGRRLGALRTFAFVSESEVDGERQRLLRSDHEHGSLLLRFALDREGRIVSLNWLHL